MKRKILYERQDGATFELVPWPIERGDAACIGCVGRTGNSAACRALPSCTPTDAVGQKLRHGHQVWRIKVESADKRTDSEGGEHD